MKRIMLLAGTIVSLLAGIAAHAQTDSRRDTIRGGGWWTGPGERPQLIAPVLRRPELRRTIQPQQTICFDKRFLMVGEIEGQVVNCCFLLNSESGFAGTFGVEETCKCEFDIDEPDFHFILKTQKGIEFRYFNSEERSGRGPTAIKHYVMTGNTHRNQMDEVTEQKILYLKEGSYREFLDGQVKARHYTTADGKADLFLAGDQFPRQLTATDYLGAYGLGYLKTTSGYYLVLGHTRGSQFNMAVRSIENLGSGGACFSAAPFITMEEETIPETIEIMSESERELTEDLARDRASNAPCADKKVAWTEYRLNATKKDKESAEKLKNETTRYTNENDVMKVASMYNPVTPFATERRELEYKVCRLEEDLANGRVSEKRMAEVMARKDCWENKIAVYKRLEDTWNELQTQHGHDRKRLMNEQLNFHTNHLLPAVQEARCR